MATASGVKANMAAISEALRAWVLLKLESGRGPLMKYLIL
jgi:hypothetical protein